MPLETLFTGTNTVIGAKNKNQSCGKEDGKKYNQYEIILGTNNGGRTVADNFQRWHMV